MTFNDEWQNFAWPETMPLPIRRAFSEMRMVSTAQEIDTAVDRIAVQMSVALQHSDPVFVVVMHGGLTFAGMLMRRMVFPSQYGFVRASRYGAETSGGELVWGAQDVPDLRGRCVVFIDDILDEGKTISALGDWARGEGAATVHNAVLVLREGMARQIPPSTWSAMRIGPGFLVGCGMDIAGYGRNLANLYVVPEESLAGSAI